MRLTHTTQRGNSVTLFIDPEDEPLYRRHTWSITTQGLAQTYTNLRLARLIMKAGPAEVVRFKDGNRYNVQRANLVVRASTMRLYTRDATTKSNRRVPRRSREEMRGVYFMKDRRGAMICRALAQVRGKQVSRTFSCNRKIGPEVNGKLGRSEAYRRAVCWRLGMLLTQGHVPDERSMEIFFEEHPRLCPFRRDYCVTRERDGSYYAAIFMGGKWRGRMFQHPVDADVRLRRAVFWVVGTLFVRELMPDEFSVGLLKKAVQFWNTPPAPEEMYSGNAQYRGGTSVDARDKEECGWDDDDDPFVLEEDSRRRSVPRSSTAYQ